MYNSGHRKSNFYPYVCNGTVWLLAGSYSWRRLLRIFGSNTILSSFCLVAGYMTIPIFYPIADAPGAEGPTVRQVDCLAGGFAMEGCMCFLALLKDHSSLGPYMYLLVVLGLLFLVSFFFVERSVRCPLIPNSPWGRKGFTALMIAYFIIFGAKNVLGKMLYNSVILAW